MRILRNKCWSLLFFVLLVVLIIILTISDKITFDMSTGKSWEKRFVLGVKISSSEINPSVHKHASFFKLIKKDCPTINIDMDKNLFLVRTYSHSNTKSDYYDLVSTTKFLDQKNITDDLYADEKSKFLRLWDSLCKYGHTTR